MTVNNVRMNLEGLPRCELCCLVAKLDNRWNDVAKMAFLKVPTAPLYGFRKRCMKRKVWEKIRSRY